MPVYEPSYDEVNFYSKKLQCTTSENLAIHGDYNSHKAQMLNVQLVRCHDRSDCKTDAQITEFFKNKFILLVYNQIRFDSGAYGENSIIPETRLLWLPISTQVIQTTPLKITTSQLILQD